MNLFGKKTSSGTQKNPEIEKLSRHFKLLSDIRGVSQDELFEILLTVKKGLDAGASEFERYVFAEQLSSAIYPKYKFSEFGRIFLEDESFIEYYKGIMDVNNWHSLDRKYTLNELLKLTLHIDADVVECGSYKGASAYLMCKAYQNSEVLVHLFDSFEGLSMPNDRDGNYWNKGSLSMPESEIYEALKEFKNHRIYKGWIPDRFSEVRDRRIGFLHVDVDLYQPTLDSLHFFYDRIVPGGVILMDDYGFTSCPGAKQAADEFFSTKKESIVSLPTGQAFVLKQV